ncbi:hypothetical protein [Planococcus donghaensis]|uniref:hypothetical protein n=1 Tax=Planococcus donghaensis TaxID=414778 RepID=UPI003736C79D
MKKLESENGYALLVVLLVVVLSLGFSATFLKGSLNHATQERTVDTSNQSVAAAEMGVLYYTSSFEKELELELLDIQKEINERLDVLKQCVGCDFESEIRVLNQNKIDEYTTLVLKKVEDLNHEKLEEDDDDYYKRNASVDDRMAYTVESAEAEMAADKKRIKIVIKLRGIAEQGQANSESILSVVFQVAIPESFLTKSTQLIYDDIYKNPPAISCTDFLSTKKYEEEGVEPFYECSLGADEKLAELLTKIKGYPHNLAPKDFMVYTDNYLENVCDPNGNANKTETSNCNSKDFEGISVVVFGNEETVTKNMNGLENVKIYINGQLTVQNLNNTSNAVLVLKELNVLNNSQNIENSTIVVLGFDDTERLAELIVDNNITLKTNAKFCLDTDRIIENDIVNFGNQITINEGSSLIYYTSQGKTYYQTKQNVMRITNYTDFLSLCNVSVNGSPTANNIDPEFDFEVEY